MNSDDQPAKNTNGDSATESLVLRLYITRGAGNSLRALANLKAILELCCPERYSLEVIDLLENPARAFEDDILVTPTLVKLAPLPCTRMMGNLSRTEVVLEALTGQQGA